MGATGQPAGSTEGSGSTAGSAGTEGSDGEQGSDSRFGRWWDASRRAVFAVFGTGAVICAGFMEVVDSSTKVLLLGVLVVLALAGLSTLFRAQIYVRLAAAVWGWVRGHWVHVSVVGALALVVVVGARLTVASGESCEDPTEVAVMVPEDGAPGFAAVADAFERDSTTPFACPEYHVTAFGVGWPALRAAFASGWGAAPGEAGAASLNLGPRPDVWIAESGAQVDMVTAEGAGQGFDVSGRTLVAGSPLVLAVPEPHTEALLATTESGDTSRELTAAATAANLDVVRANPEASFAAALHTERLYAESDTGADSAALEALELDLGHALEQARLPVGTDGALLCRLDELSRTAPPQVAVLTTERAIGGRGAACPESGAGASDTALVPFYPDSALGLDYTAVRLSWADATPAGRRADAASDLVEWLRTSEGQTALRRDVGVRGLDGQPPADVEGRLPGLRDAPVVEPGGNLVAHTRVVSTEELYRKARRPARVLVMVDASASMGRPADGNRKRIDVAERGVLGALGHLSGSDEVGIWTFSGSARSSPHRVLDLTRSEVATSAAPEQLGALRPKGRTPLYDAVEDGTSYLVDLDPDSASRRHLTALVVLTDGENFPGDGPGSELTAADLVESARAQEASGVRVYVVAVGEASCQVSDLQQIAAEWDGECWDSSFGELESTLASLFGQLGGR